MNYLFDEDFLIELDNLHLKETFAKIILLNREEEIIEEIQGRVSSGNVNVDGTSNVRRTCSLTLVANEMNIHEYYWGLHAKFKLYVGLRNTIRPEYPDIIWFPQGTYIISSFSTSQSLSSYTINIQGKDKMTLLNGEIGGTVMSLTHNFGERDEEDANGNIVHVKNLIKEIIIDSVHEFAAEPLHNIIVNDLDEYGAELLEYRGSDPVYVIYDEKTQEPINFVLDKNTKYLLNGVSVSLDNENIIYNPLFDLENNGVVNNYSKLKDYSGRTISIAKIKSMTTVGYRMCDIVYAGDLILNVGETITSMLDRLVSMLGNFEYFYDLDGRFIFQKKRAYIQTLFNNIQNKEDQEEFYVRNFSYSRANTYSLENNNLVSSFSNTPNYADLRNDFSIWGTKSSSSGGTLPVHMRFAIDKKPRFYVSYDNTITYVSLDFITNFSLMEDAFNLTSPRKGTKEYANQVVYSDRILAVEKKTELTDFSKKLEKAKIAKEYWSTQDLKNITPVDWRELIYQMAIDFRKYNRNSGDKDFYYVIARNNYNEYPNGITGYEPYYIDMEGFWRELYNPFYSNSWKQLFVSEATYKKETEEIVEKIKFTGKLIDSTYYYVPKQYIQCTTNDKFSSSVGYYEIGYDSTLGINTYKIVSGLDRSTFLDNPQSYYKLDTGLKNNTAKENCIIVEKYRNNGLGYYSSEGVPLSYVSKQSYEAAPWNYYYQNGYSFEPVAEMLPFYRTETYYTDFNGTEAKITSRKQEDYEKEPWNYYYYEYQYKQLKSTDTFSYGTRYYVKAKESTTDRDIYSLIPVDTATPEWFNEKVATYGGTMTDYYVEDLDSSGAQKKEKVQCWRILRDYNANALYTYYPNDINKAEKIPESQFKSLANKKEDGNPLCEVIPTYTCCVHPKKYKELGSIFQKVLDEYTETGWIKEVSENPASLNFWFDFIDNDSELQKYSNHNVGNRPKAVNDSNVKAIYFRETPNILFCEAAEVDKYRKLGYTCIQTTDSMKNLFTISSQGKSAKDVLDEWLYRYAQCVENISVNTIPIYHLKVNTRIYVNDRNSGINGDYIISRYTVPLGNSGNTTITANKAVERIY